jgi:hypothetical protein
LVFDAWRGTVDASTTRYGAGMIGLTWPKAALQFQAHVPSGESVVAG